METAHKRAFVLQNVQDRLASNECFRQYVEDALHVPVHLYTPADYNGVMQGLLGGTIDMAWLGASSYAGTYIQNPDAVEPPVNVGGWRFKTTASGVDVQYTICTNAGGSYAYIRDIYGRSLTADDTMAKQAAL